MPYTPTTFTDDVVPPGVSAFELNKLGAGIQTATALAEEAVTGATSLAGDVTGDTLHSKVTWSNGSGAGLLASRPTTFTALDAGRFYYATDEDGGTPYRWDGAAWQRYGRSYGDARLRPQAAPYNCKADALKLLDLIYDPATPGKIRSATHVFTSADVGKLLVSEATGQTIAVPSTIANGSSQLYMTSAKLAIVATGGTFTLSFNGQTTSGITATPLSTDIQSALEALSTIGTGNVTVTSLTGTTFLIQLLPGASSQDIYLLTKNAAGLTNTTNGPIASATLSANTWDYGTVGLRVQGAFGASGAVREAFIGSIDQQFSNRANLVDIAGLPITASVAFSGTTNLLNWNRKTITSVDLAGDPTGKTVVLDSNLDMTLAALSNLTGYVGTDNAVGLNSLFNDARTNNTLIELPVGNLMSSRAIITTNTTNSFGMTGQGSLLSAIWTTSLDNDNDGGNIRILGGSATNRGIGVYMKGFTFGCVTAHYRNGSGPTKNNLSSQSTGIIISRMNSVCIHDVVIDHCYGVAWNLSNISHFMVSNCGAKFTGADSFNINNDNGVTAAQQPIPPDVTDGTFIGCWSEDSGDDMYAINQPNGNMSRVKRIVYVGCRGARQRNNALGRGLALTGGDDITAGDMNFRDNNSSAVDIAATAATNAKNNATITTPSTGAVVTFATAPNNITTGTLGQTRTQMKLFNGTTGQSWIGEVASVTGGGTVVTLEAQTVWGYAVTCPFTGGPFLAQWGLNTDQARFGKGGGKGYTVTNILSNGSSLNPSGDSLTMGAVRLLSNGSTGLTISDIQMSRLHMSNCWQSGIITDSGWLATNSDIPLYQTISDVQCDGFSVSTTGIGPLVGSRPWCGILIRVGNGLYFRNGKIKDTSDEAVRIEDSQGANSYGGVISFENVNGIDIARDFTTAAPLAYAFNASNKTGTGFVVELKNCRLRNPSGTAGGTQYVCNYVAGRAPNGSTIRDIQSDITVDVAGALRLGLVEETQTRWFWILSPWLARGRGQPGDGTGGTTGPLTGAGISAKYLRSDGTAGTNVYTNTTGLAAGWVADPVGGVFVPRYTRPSTGWAQVIGTTAATAATASTVNKVYAIPLDLENSGNLAGLGLTQTILAVLGAATVGSLRLAAATDVAGKPGAYIAGTELVIDLTTGAVPLVQQGTFTPIPVTAGRIWLLSAVQITGTPTTYPTLHTVPGALPGVYYSSAQTGPAPGLAESGQTLTDPNTLAAYNMALLTASTGTPWRVQAKIQ